MKYICDSCEKYPCSADETKLMLSCPAYSPKPKPQTKADLIRAMTDEELAEFLLKRDLNVVEKSSKAVGFTYKFDREQCLANVIGWLKEEAVSDG